MNTARAFKNRIAKAVNIFNFFRVGEKSAALAYYALFALSPILILLTSVASLSYFGALTESGLEEFFVRYFGPQAHIFFDRVVENTQTQSVNLGVAIVGFLLVAYGAMNFFRAIQNSLLELFSVSMKDKNVVKNYLRVYLYAFGYLIVFLSFITALFVSQYFLTSGIELLESVFSYTLSAVTIRVLTAVVILVLLTTFLGLSYRLFSKRTVGWDDAFIGGFAASIFVLLLNGLLGFYFAFSSALRLYGAASFLVAILLWVYLFSVILFSGALIARYASKV